MGFYFIVWFQKISIPPPPPPWKGFAVRPSLPSGFSKIGPQNLPHPTPLRNFQTFRTRLGHFAISN